MNDKQLLEKDLPARIMHGVKLKYVGKYPASRLSKDDIVLFKQYDEGMICVNGYKTNAYIPILRPMSDLAVPIAHNGETFVPIVELAKLIGFDVSEYEIKEENNTIVMLGKTIRHPDSMIYSFNFFDVDIDDDFEFSYGSIMVVNGSEVISYYPLKNQSQLYDKLTEHHFNWRNLPAHLWVDVNSLETNPYK